MCGRNAANFTPTFFKIEWLEKFESIMHQIEEVSMFGWGEPTVHPHFVELLMWLDKYPVRKYFCTNGMRLGALTDAIFQHKVDIIAISLDGANPTTNNKILLSVFNPFILYAYYTHKNLNYHLAFWLKAMYTLQTPM